MPPRGTSSAMTLKRIHREVADLKKEDLGNMVLEPMEHDFHVWKGTIPGPEGSVYEGGVFHVEINLPADYPFSAPRVVFKTRIYHMNISETGGICIDILKSNWSPALSLFKVMLSISSLLTDPNPKDPLVPSVATQYVRNRKQHDATAQEWTTLYAKPKPTLSAAAATSAPSSSSTQVSGSSRGRGGRRGAAATQRNTGGPRAATAVIVIDDDHTTASSSSSSASSIANTRGKRKRGPQGQAETEVHTAGEGESANGRRNPTTTSKRRRTTKSSDVIEIDDD
ncbi:hypothetical protein AGABI1DRAFT_114991 [Agaricus bisporus var. burnettii JB137-S8]|uniref:E2 ubiquitin-conjugating enzyme n=1 Tax=Agaricus bisporus var. burnettii (strain JB137-S8 / ATCC MYA-4627 / FGSC 10392) TaxID=597362 RepID=K5X450_AGABU|nr:uncharacterized protein AGABI1DRAFT_114991 [Agaricus bisporus var. burnettii JB137-S8]EKM77697.1 hypothetical protein AGABI1DRAFT_114991 [Agaricus bisporus var. burnettii JB137-S8]